MWITHSLAIKRFPNASRYVSFLLAARWDLFHLLALKLVSGANQRFQY
jgi:hypothetical protein